MGCGRRPVGASVLVERYLRIVRFWTVWTVLRHVPARVLMCPEVNLLEPSHRVMPMATPAPGWVSYAALIVACVAALTPIVSAHLVPQLPVEQAPNPIENPVQIKGSSI